MATKKIIQICEETIDALKRGETIEITPLPIRDRSDETFIGARSPNRYVAIASSQYIGNGRFQIRIEG